MEIMLISSEKYETGGNMIHYAAHLLLNECPSLRLILRESITNSRTVDPLPLISILPNYLKNFADSFEFKKISVNTGIV